MKKILSMVLALTLASTFAACNDKTKSKENELCGTWEIASVEANGSKFTVDEIEAMGDDSLSGIGLVIKEGGQACLLENGDGDIVDWSLTSDGIRIGVIDCKIVDGNITIENNNMVMSFRKISDSQTITKGSNEAKNANSANIDSVDDAIELEESIETSSKVEWKEFLNEYEEWVDKYVQITKKYMDNPLDMSILSDYTDMMTELTEWSNKTQDMQAELEKASPTELVEYSAELARIAAKLANALY